MDDFRLTHGYWEAKDEDDDLPSEVVRKLEAGYPRDNILFQDPTPRHPLAERIIRCLRQILGIGRN